MTNKSKHIVITGGSTGIGASVIELYRADGHEVTALDIQEPDNASRWIKTDLCDPKSINDAVAKIDQPIDALINNAGLPPREGLTAKILEVNFFGFREALTGLETKLAKGASIVNVASRAGAFWRDNLAQVTALMALERDGLDEFIDQNEIDHVRAYNLSKEAMIVFTLSQTERMIAKNLRMNSVSPAAVSTGILDDFTQAFGPKVAANIKRVGRPGSPEEIARIIRFLASEDSAWIKGQDITIDGGMTALAMTDMMGLN